MDPDRLRALNETKLRALVRARLGGDHFVPVAAGTFVALAVGAELWVYAPGESSRALGRAMALATTRGVDALHLVVDDDGGGVARRAGALKAFADVWRVAGTQLVAAEVAALPPPHLPPSGVEPFVALLHEAGVDVVVEHGVVTGEVRGLEVARISETDDQRLTLDVGVGRFDQEATAVLHGDKTPREALARAAAEVQRHRRAGAAPHPVGRLARERWLRAQVLDKPSLAGLSSLEPVEPSLPRRNLRDAFPAAAFGCDDNGHRVLVVCSVGVDLELVPETADLIQREKPERVVLLMPTGDQVPVQRALVALLPVPTELVALEGEWVT